MPIIRLDPDSPMGRKLQQLQTIFYGLLALPLMLFLIGYLQAIQFDYQPLVQGDDLLSIHLAVWVVVLALSALVVKSYNSRIKSFAGPASLEQKFDSYIGESRRLYFMIMPIILLPAVAIWATGVVFYGALFSLMIILVASLRPTVEQFIQRYRLSKEEEEALRNIS